MWVVNDATALIQKTLMTGNTESSGAFANQNAVINIENSIISNYNSPDSYLFSAASMGEINLTNVTIANNVYPNATSLFRTIGANSSIDFIGGIIWGNTFDSLVDDGGNGITISHSIIQYESTGLTNTIQADPLFTNPTNGDYHIKYNSPARDHFNSNLNKDFEGDNRPQGLLDDAGADEWTDLIFNNEFEQN